MELKLCFASRVDFQSIPFYLDGGFTHCITEHIQVGVPICMFFVDHIVLVEESRECANSKLKLSQENVSILSWSCELHWNKGFWLSRGNSVET